MRIFQVIEGSSNATVAGSQTWHRNLYEPLVEMGHDVLLFSVTEGRIAMQRDDTAGRARFSQKLLDTFHREHARKPFALFFSYLMDGMVDPSVVDAIRQAGVPTCNFSCNNAHQFFLVDELSPHFDFNLHAEKDARDKFIAIGASPLWWPMASNPKYFKPQDVPRTIQASFVGANYGLRARGVAHLLENGIDAHAFGPGWVDGARTRWRSLAKRYLYIWQTLSTSDPERQNAASAKLSDHDFRRFLSARFPANVHAPVTDDELISLYSRSHISLGFLEVYSSHNPSGPVTRHLHLREFEAPMCGALYCTGYMDELAEMFEPDKEVLVYRTQDELLDKVRFYSAHPVQAELIRAAGRVRALAEHTYQERFRQLFRTLGLV